ncbi:MAG: hypothetical protein JWN02_630 [Acidobacteria bacterium]|nr:hypothetical protein [Acidobacteriota bacterium]
MIATSITLRRVVPLLIAVSLAFPRMAWTQCAGIAEEGRWRNLDNKGEPSFIDVKMTGGCGDQVLNGEQTGSSVHYTMGVWVRQSTGKFYGFTPVKAFYRPWKGNQWLRGNVYRGGTQDQLWLHVEEHNKRQQLHVLIRHQSLDSRPSSQSEYWFAK